MQKTENYIDQIIKKIDSIKDSDLKNNIYRLIYERNKLLESVNMDVLTGAYNRRIIDSIDNYSVIALCDIDDFKYINDTNGHDIGDRVLKVVSKILIDNSNKEDIVCRYGGDGIYLTEETIEEYEDYYDIIWFDDVGDKD